MVVEDFGKSMLSSKSKSTILAVFNPTISLNSVIFLCWSEDLTTVLGADKVMHILEKQYTMHGSSLMVSKKSTSLISQNQL